MKELTFITVVDENGRTSTLGLHGKRKAKENKNTISIIGNLPHNAEIVPNTVRDAEMLIKWLEEWVDNKK